MNADADKDPASLGGTGAGGERSALHRFLLQLVHDLRSPLNAGAMWLSVLCLKQQPVETRKALDAMQRGIDRQIRILGDLAAAVAVDAGPPELKPARTPVAELMERVVATAAQGPERRSLGTIGAVAIAGDVDVDVECLEQAFAAVAGTLGAASPVGASVEIDGCARPEDGVLVVTLRARDCALPAGCLRALLEVPWRRSPGAYEGKDLALGLFVARRAIEAHGGTLEALDDRGAAGAAFQITLPLHT